MCVLVGVCALLFKDLESFSHVTLKVYKNGGKLRARVNVVGGVLW